MSTLNKMRLKKLELKSKDNSARNLNLTKTSLQICTRLLLLLLPVACFEDSVKTELRWNKRLLHCKKIMTLLNIMYSAA